MYLYTSMFPLLWGGFYRILPSEAFPWELGMGYSQELFLGLIPSTLFMIQTNAESETMLLGVQSASILIKMFLIILFVIELPIMLCEIRHFRKMQKSEIRGWVKPTEEQRRDKNYKVASWSAFSSSFVIVLTVIIALSTIPARSCDSGYSLELATCEPCKIQGCINCEEDSSMCLQCKPGHVFVEGKGCLDCDTDPSAVNCEACSYDGARTVC